MPALTVTEIVQRRVPLRDGIGKAHEPLSTTQPRAQQFYDQGLAYLHSYEWLDAARSFNTALARDPGLAMAQVGLTFAYAELNKPDAARTALASAERLQASASEHERLHVRSRAAQMAAEAAPADRAKLAAYRAALDAALQLKGLEPVDTPDVQEVVLEEGKPLTFTATFETLLYPVAYGGERSLKLDMIEQGCHVLKPHGTFIVLSPYDVDDFFAPALKKVFGKVHVPMEGNNSVFWLQNFLRSGS